MSNDATYIQRRRKSRLVPEAVGEVTDQQELLFLHGGIDRIALDSARKAALG
jgi:hypothetical protein